MSILRNLVDSLIAASSNEGFERVKMRELETQIKEAIEETTKDGTITADEIADISKLTNKLELSSDDFDHIRLNILENLLDNILADGAVKDDEMSLFKEVESSIKIAPEDKTETLKAKIEKVKALHK